MNDNLIDYYQKRALEYDKVYLNPAEQDDLMEAAALFQSWFLRSVLEIACGTGYWTEKIAETATTVYATDVNENVIALAKARQTGKNIQYAIADMYDFQLDQRYNGLFGGFIWSHIPIQNLDALFQQLKQNLEPGSVVAFIDSKPVAGTNHDLANISQTDAHGNTFQTRKLEDGSTHLVLKNFPTEAFLAEKLAVLGTDIAFFQTRFYWMVRCTVHAV
jgi:SAM-dependent methyltransferase